jgi:Mu-like prophage I protein
MSTMSFLVDMAKIQLNDSGPTWIQGFPLGTWHHPTHGEISITPERVKRFAEGVAKRVRGQDLNIDYDHQAGEAAGWVRAAEDRGRDGLWLSVDWTPTARQQLSEKKYRYFSPEFQDEWENPAQPGVKHQDVLFGGALTNRPFLKGIVPINLSEAFAAQLAEGGNVGNQGTGGTPPGPEGGSSGNKNKGDKNKGDTSPVQLTEAQLLEMPAIKALMEQNKQLADQVTKLAEQGREATARQQLAEMNQPVNGRVLSPAVLDTATKMLTEPANASQYLTTLLQAFRDGNGTVELGERGSARTRMTDPGAADKIKAFMDVVTQIQTERKVDYMTAVSAAQRENVQLAEAYSNAIMAQED